MRLPVLVVPLSSFLVAVQAAVLVPAPVPLRALSAAAPWSSLLVAWIVLTAPALVPWLAQQPSL
jgi:hypothetical protein